MDVMEGLLQLYGRHPSDAIEGDGALLLAQFNVPDRNALLALDGYAPAFALVSGRAACVSELAVRFRDPAEQARECLRLLRDMLDNGDSEPAQRATRRLVEDRLRPAWPLPQQAWYDQKAEILEWRDFFVSYTDRDAPALNRQFRSLITSSMGLFPKGDELKDNHVASVIARHLRRYQGLTGFFADDDMRPGERIAAGVDGYCRRAFALVQLIEPLSFDREPPRNWCFYEYQVFTDNPSIARLPVNKDRHFFILTEDQLDAIEPANMAPAQRIWHQRIEALKQINIALPTERNNTLRAKIKAIANQILTLRCEIIDAWLAH